MLRSMTAFGRSTATSSLGECNIELQSVNRKYLDYNIILPKEFLRFETAIKKRISETITRGYITVRVSLMITSQCPQQIQPNLPLARQMKAAWDAIASDLNLPEEKGFHLSMFSSDSGVLQSNNELQNEEDFNNLILQALDEATQNLLIMKDHEGKNLQEDISERISTIQQHIETIADHANEAVDHYREKLKNSIEEILPGVVDNEDRILREISIYADRIDITEEITRSRSHIDQFLHLLQSDNRSSGKKLEFIIQELNREVNTIGSKNANITVSHCVIEIKSELEKIREQLQNVE